MREQYMVTRKLSNKFQQTHKPVNDKNENPLATTNEQFKRWVEHFEELLDGPAPERPPDSQPTLIFRSTVTFQQKKRSGGQSTCSRTEKQQGLMRFQQKPSKLILKHLSVSRLTSSRRSGRKKVFRRNGKKAYLSSCHRKETKGGTVTTGEL